MTPWPNRLLRLEYLFRKNIAYVIEQPANSLLPLYKPLQEREGERERERKRGRERKREREKERESLQTVFFNLSYVVSWLFF